MLTVLRVISQHLNSPVPSGNMARAIQSDKFKIIYVQVGFFNVCKPIQLTSC